MTVDKQVAFVFAFLPLLAFVAVAISEVRSGGSTRDMLRRLVAPILGIAAFGFFWTPDILGPVTQDRSVLLSHVMTMVSAVIACSGVFIRYARQRSAVWMACGGLMLTFMWMFNRAYY